MARLVGLTVDIGGNTENLKTALKEPEKSASTLQAKLKEINRALKLDPTNTELLTQKQELLKDAVVATKEKLELLKKAQEDFKESGGDINSKSYIELESDIIKVEKSLKSLEDQQTKVSASLQSMSTSISKFGDKAYDAGKAMLPVSAGVTAVGFASVKAFEEVDDGIDTIAKKTGATGDAMNDFKEIFNDIATEIPSDMADVGDAIGELNTRFGFTGDILKESSEQFLKFANINDTDVNTAVQLVSRAMGDAGIDAKEYSMVLDMLTKAAQISGISIDKLTENITKYGAPMRALGFDTASSIAIFAQWEKAGVNTEIAFSGMKKAISNFMKDGKDAKVEFGKLITGIQDGSITAQEALDIFGTKAGPDLVDAIQQGRFSYEDFLSLIESSEGTVSGTFDETQDGIDRFKTAANAGKIALAEFGETISDALAPILMAITEVLRTLSKILNNLPPGVKEIIVLIGLIVVAIGPLLMLIGSISKGVASCIMIFGKLGPLFSTLSKVGVQAFGLLKTAAGGLFSFIVTNPVVATITAIIGIFVLLYQKCEWFRDGVNAILGSIGTFISDCFTNAKNFLFVTVPETIDNVVSWFASMPGGIAGAIASIPEMLFDFGLSMLHDFVSGILINFGLPSEKVKEIADSIVNTISELSSKFFGWGREMIENLGKGIASLGSWIGDKAKGIAGSIASFLHFTRPDEGPLRNYETWMPDFIGGMAKGIKDNVGLIKHAVDSVATNMIIDPSISNNAMIKTQSNDTQLLKELVSMINGGGSQDAPNNAKTGNMVVPIYIGQRLLDEIIIDCNARQVVKSGGR